MKEINEIAEDNLSTIRKLLEKSTAYRAISAPIALIGGSLSCILGAYWIFSEKLSNLIYTNYYFISWHIILIIIAIINLFYLIKSAKHEKKPIFSKSFYIAYKLFIPPMLMGGLLGIFAIRESDFMLATLLWLSFYGLALLSTSSFAPRSLKYLGFLFFVTGFSGIIFLNVLSENKIAQINTIKSANIIMMLTFGFYHIVYATYVFIRKK